MIDSNSLDAYEPTGNVLQNRIIVISGASDGIGRQVALSCAQHGATIVLLGRTLSKLEQVYDEIEQAGLPQPAIFPINFDSATEQDYQQLKNALQAEFGYIDGLFNNAAELGPRTPIDHYPLDQWQKIMRVNLDAPFLLTKTMLPLLRNSKDARIVFSSSSVAQRGKAYWGAYAASNAATLNLMQTLADELEETHIRVNCINPGPVRTKLRAEAYPGENPSTIPTAQSIVHYYLYLLGPDSAPLNGEIITVQNDV